MGETGKMRVEFEKVTCYDSVCVVILEIKFGLEYSECGFQSDQQSEYGMLGILKESFGSLFYILCIFVNCFPARYLVRIIAVETNKQGIEVRKMIGVVKGTGAFAPEKILDNHEIAKLVDTSDEWIRERTGIVKRHIATSETTTMMAAKAARMALSDAGVCAAELDMIIVSTISPEQVMPCAACGVQREIGAERAICFDLSAACSGFVVAYNTACAYIESGICKKILIIGSESLSNLTNWKDRGTCILFGDGAGAAVIVAEEGRGYLPAAYSDGTLGEVLTLRSRHDHNPFAAQNRDDESDRYYMEMDGQAVFKFAARKVPQVIEEVLEKNKLKKEEIAYYVLHQANQRIVEAVARRLKESVSKFPMNMMEYGNTSSASIPILLHEMHKKRLLNGGDRIIIAGFGGGLTWGASVLSWK